MNRILVVDDEPDFVRLLTDVLTGEGFQVSVATDGPAALRQASETHPDAILLDWNLPGKNGVEVCLELKSDPATRAIPVIMLTARARETDTVLGLQMGAEDYVSKRAMRPLELVARIRAAQRKAATPPEAAGVVADGVVVLDAVRRRVTVDGAPVELRTKEFELLKMFLQRRGHVLTRAYLTETIWGGQYFGGSRTIDTTVAHLRARLGSAGDRIRSVVGVGYRWE
jgi:DNA-binding response OmpR family regulator